MESAGISQLPQRYSSSMEGQIPAWLQGLFKALQEALQGSPLDKDVLSLVEVCAMLRCSEDTLRRVPLGQLPVYRVGKSNLYLREEVIQFLRAHKLHRPGAASLSDILATGVDALIHEMVESDSVDVREPSERTAG